MADLIVRNGQVVERLVPAMVLRYVAGVLVMLVVIIETVPAAFQSSRDNGGALVATRFLRISRNCPISGNAAKL